VGARFAPRPLKIQRRLLIEMFPRAINLSS
jgi:hypothetical protein